MTLSCRPRASTLLTVLVLLAVAERAVPAELGVGALPEPGAEVLFDGSREMLDEKWT